LNPRDPFAVLNLHRKLEELRAKAKVKSARQVRIEVLFSERQQLESHLKDLEFEIGTLERYRDTGKYDRFAFREGIRPLELQLRNVQGGLSKINEELEQLENDYQAQHLRTLEAWDQKYSESVQYFSIFSLSGNSGVSEYFIIPASLRSFCPDDVPTLLSDSTSLGSSCLFRAIGERFTNVTPGGFSGEVEVLDTRRVSDEILEGICVRLEKTEVRNVIPVSLDPSFGGDVGRWKDGAREKDYITCSNCGGYFPLNGFCRNC
jgi:hypothetical protein